MRRFRGKCFRVANKSHLTPIQIVTVWCGHPYHLYVLLFSCSNIASNPVIINLFSFLSLSLSLSFSKSSPKPSLAAY